MTDRFVRLATSAAALAVLAAACSSSPTGPDGGGGNGGSTATVTSLAVTGNASIVAGGTTQLTATATYSDGSTRNVTATTTWTSANSAVATVSASGLVTARGTGLAQIVAVFEGQSAQRNVTVAPPIFQFTINNVSLTAIGTCDDFLQGSGIGEFAARGRIIRTGASTLTLFESPGYPGNPDDLRVYSLQDNASLNLTSSASFNLAGDTGQSVRIEFNATEWDEQIVIIPPSIRFVRDSDMNNRSASRTHAFSGSNFGDLGAQSIVIGNQSCGIRLNYFIASTVQ
jgi:hypothetical protein